MDVTVNAVEMTGRIDAEGSLVLDRPLPPMRAGRVRVVVLPGEEAPAGQVAGADQLAATECRRVSMENGSCYLEDPEAPLCEDEPFCELE